GRNWKGSAARPHLTRGGCRRCATRSMPAWRTTRPGRGSGGNGSGWDRAGLWPAPAGSRTRAAHPAGAVIVRLAGAIDARAIGYTGAERLRLFSRGGVLRMNDEPKVHPPSPGLAPPADFTTFMRNYQHM